MFGIRKNKYQLVSTSASPVGILQHDFLFADLLWHLRTYLITWVRNLAHIVIWRSCELPQTPKYSGMPSSRRWASNQAHFGTGVVFWSRRSGRCCQTSQFECAGQWDLAKPARVRYPVGQDIIRGRSCYESSTIIVIAVWYKSNIFNHFVIYKSINKSPLSTINICTCNCILLLL